MDFVFFSYSIRLPILINWSGAILTSETEEKLAKNDKQFHIWTRVIKEKYLRHRDHIFNIRDRWGDEPKDFGIGGCVRKMSGHSIEKFRKGRDYYVYNVKNIDQDQKRWTVHLVHCPSRDTCSYFATELLALIHSGKDQALQYIAGPKYYTTEEWIDVIYKDAVAEHQTNEIPSEIPLSTAEAAATLISAASDVIRGGANNVNALTFSDEVIVGGKDECVLSLQNDDALDVKIFRTSDEYVALATMKRENDTNNIIITQDAKTVTVESNWMEQTEEFVVYRVTESTA